MHVIFLLQIWNCLKNLVKNYGCLGLFEVFMLFNFVIKFTSRTKLHNNINVKWVFIDLVKFCYVWMIQMSHNYCFIQYFFYFLNRVFFFINYFDGSELFGSYLLNLLYFSKRSRTKYFQYFIVFLNIMCFNMNWSE